MNPFIGCISLKSIESSHFLFEYNQIVSSDKKELIAYLEQQDQKEITNLFEEIEVIKSYAIYNIKSLDTVLIPPNVVQINEKGFKDCENLENVYYFGVNQPQDSINSFEGNSKIQKVKVNEYYYTTYDSYAGFEIEKIDSGKCGENCNYSFDSQKGLMIISGEGEMDEWSTEDEVPWKDLNESITVVVIEEGITSIGTYSFNAFLSLRSIYLPSTIESIGANVFAGCSELEIINMKNQVQGR